MAMQIVQVIGACLILAGFVVQQIGWWHPEDIAYLSVNFVGSVALDVVALNGSQWGFVLLETAWAVVSMVTFVRKFGVRTRS